MALTSAKNILSTYNIIGAKEENKRKPKNEFQAYAYRLAHDLNDLVNLKIYMMLAKNTERAVLERAYSFVADSTSNDKGRLFLWKLKKLKQEFEVQRNKNNFSYDYVLKKQKLFRNLFAKNIIEKTDLDIGPDINQIIFDNISQLTDRFKRVLVIGNSSKKIIKYLIDSKVAVTTIDYSKDVNKINKSDKAKSLTKDFLENSFKDVYFDIVILNNFWHNVPVDSEIKYAYEVKRILKQKGKIIIYGKNFDENKQEWKSIKHLKDDVWYFLKSSTENNVKKIFEKFEFNVEKDFSSRRQILQVLNFKNK